MIKFIHRVYLFFKNKIYGFYSDETFIKKVYNKRFNRKLNLDNPKYFTEKIQWLKLNDRKPIKSILADKFLVKMEISKIIDQSHLIPTLWAGINVEDIPFNKLPNQYIIKTNNSSGTNIIVSKNNYSIYKGEKIEYNENYIRKKVAVVLKKNGYDYGREWEYKNISPMIIIEELIKDSSGNQILNDIKVHCFNGKVKIIQCISDRIEGVKENFFDESWNELDFYYFSDKKAKINKPFNLHEIIELAETLAKGFIYVRVDLYSVNNRIYFGEMTFHPAAGFMNFVPNDWDAKLGELIKINL